MKIIIGADVVPTKNNCNSFLRGDISDVIDENISQALENADIRIFNLETPLCDKQSPIDKCGPNLIAPAETILGIKKLNPTLLTLANNHIMDHGSYGLFSTINLLKKNEINYVGVGENIGNIKHSCIIDCDNKKIGIYACCEHEFSIANTDLPGANPFDALESPDHVAELKRNCDYVIVLYHGGKEHYRYPSPNLQKVCRKLCEKGAGLVVCQHSHCIGCMEEYNDSTIIYGQGNFIFDAASNEYWNTGMLIGIGDNFKINFIPLEKKCGMIHKADEKSAEKILAEFYLRSEQIKVPEFINQKYREFAENMSEGYLMQFSGNGLFRFTIRVLRKLKLNKLYKRLLHNKYNKLQLLKMLNYIECEAHRELVLEGFQDLL